MFPFTPRIWSDVTISQIAKFCVMTTTYNYGVDRLEYLRSGKPAEVLGIQVKYEYSDGSTALLNALLTRLSMSNSFWTKPYEKIMSQISLGTLRSGGQNAMDSLSVIEL